MTNVHKIKRKDPRQDLSNYEPIMLASPELFEKYWLPAVPLIQKCIDRTMHGEMTVDDIMRLTIEEKMWVMVLKSDKFEKPEVKFVLVLEVAHYPQFSSLNVVVIGGANLKMLIKRYWGFVCGWAYIIGIRRMECLVSPAMERILQGVGFKRGPVKMFQDLGYPQ